MHLGTDLINASRKINAYFKGKKMGDLKQEILDLIWEYGGIDGGHHKQWLIDQIVRKLTETQDEYDNWIRKFNDGEDGPDTYEWELGSI